jgi:hypothetical protein
MMEPTPLEIRRASIQNAKVPTQLAEDETAKQFMPQGRLEEIFSTPISKCFQCFRAGI